MAGAESIITAAEQHLATARLGLADIRAGLGRGRSGLMNAIVFGRSATFALQKLKSEVDGFEAWYKVEQEEMKANPLFKYFNDLRVKVEHQAHIPGGVRAFINSNADFEKLGPAPPFARFIFLGDGTGGAGWMLKFPDGSEEKYYVSVPEEMVSLTLEGAPISGNAATVVSSYLDSVAKILEEARRRFVSAK